MLAILLEQTRKVLSNSMFIAEDYTFYKRVKLVFYKVATVLILFNFKVDNLRYRGRWKTCSPK